jgi:uncharacterized membrane protein YqhA
MVFVTLYMYGRLFTLALFIRAHLPLLSFKANFAKKGAAILVFALHRLVDHILANKAIIVILVQLDPFEHFVDRLSSSQWRQIFAPLLEL